MSEQHSILGLIFAAGPMVQFVMASLLLGSVWSWVLIIQRHRVVTRAKKHAALFEQTFWSGADLLTLYRQVANATNVIGLEAVFRDGFREFTRLRQDLKSDPDAVMEAVHRAMRVARAREEARLERGLSALAIIGSISPYVGLFGTVWGIMNSFIGLAAVKQATLAAVAPGIAEALIATAMGLAAAIPAIVAYNRYLSMADSVALTYENFADEFAAILHRKVHQRSE